MDTPLTLTFHQLPHSDALEQTVRHEAQELERIFDRIVSCHVVVEPAHLHAGRQHAHHVRIELGIPGQRIVISETPDESDAHLSVREAFRAARAHLEQHLDRRRDNHHPHDNSQ